MSDGLPCSGCPFLDLGTRYPVGDVRDPYRRMPDVFRALRGLYGDGMMRHTGRTRVRIEKLLKHYCTVQRSRHGLCTRRRSLLCQRVVLDAIAHGRTAPSHGDRYAYVQQSLKAAVNDERTNELMKSTVVDRQAVALDVRDLFREVPAA